MYRNVFFLLCLLFFGQEASAQDKRHTEVAIRLIGHQIMLSSGDSSSRVLPIEKIGDGYKLRFESELQFEPKRLVSLIDSLAKTHKISEHYIVEVEECKSSSVVYSYEMGLTSQTNLVPCQSRILPKACYTITISLLDQKGEVNTASSTRILEFSLFFSIAAFGLFWAFKSKKRSKADLTLIMQ